MVEALVILVSYAVGSINAGYYLVRLVSRRDIRDLGSGNAGAKNAGRVLGAYGFAAVFAFDFAKGAAALALATGAGLDGWALALVTPAVVAGHIWPPQLRFRGGRGAATSLGAIAVYHPLAALAGIAAFLPAFAVLRAFTISGLVGYALVPPFLLVRDGVQPVSLSLAVTSLMVIVAHAGHLQEFARRGWARLARVAG